MAGRLLSWIERFATDARVPQVRAWSSDPQSSVVQDVLVRDRTVDLGGLPIANLGTRWFWDGSGGDVGVTIDAENTAAMGAFDYTAESHQDDR